MPRYIDADALIEMCERMMQEPWNQGTAPHSWADAYDDFISDILRHPTADVIPKDFLTRKKDEAYERGYAEAKTEVEMLQGALKAEERHNELTMEMAQKALANAKSEVVRGIFEELARKSTYVFPTMLYTIAKRDVDELKKKYAPKECPTCKHFVGCEPSTLGVCDLYEEVTE